MVGDLPTVPLMAPTHLWGVATRWVVAIIQIIRILRIVRQLTATRLVDPVRGIRVEVDRRDLAHMVPVLTALTTVLRPVVPVRRAVVMPVVPRAAEALVRQLYRRHRQRVRVIRIPEVAAKTESSRSTKP
jgi:hypothetical protein